MLVVASGLPVFGLSNLSQSIPGRSSPRCDGWTCAALAIFVALTLPCLSFRYLPMVDLPQHEAIVSIMAQLHNRSLGFDSYYTWAPTRTLYIAPYALGVALARLMSLNHAMHGVVFCAVLSYPVGILACLRALGRPAYLALLAIPLVYNHSFFWGFVHFNFAIGLAFLTLAMLIGNWSGGKAILVVLLSIATTLTHVYGLIVIGVYVGLWMLFGDRRVVSSRLWALAPAFIGFVVWLGMLVRAQGFAGYEWKGIVNRWVNVPEAIAGGWRDDSEALALCGLLLVIGVLSYRSLPITRARWRQLSQHQQVAWAFIGLNMILYLGMPELSIAANKAVFRHAEMAALTVPLTLGAKDASDAPNWARLGLIALIASVVVSSWYHFTRFDKEARSFDAIIDAVPERPRMAQLTYDRCGQVARAPVYMHFAAYAQALRGGLLAVSFPVKFWNIPISVRTDIILPPIPNRLEWNPQLFGTARLEEHFDTVIVRASRTRQPPLPQPFPYRLQLQNGPWRLLRRRESIHE